MTRTAARAQRMADAVGGSTGLIGVALLALPERSGALVGIRDDVGLRVIGAVDAALAVAILGSRPRWPWLALRVAVNLPIGGYFVARGRAAPAPAARVLGVGIAAAALLDA